jgi:hypothetical protein
MSVNALQKAIQRRGADRLIIVLMQLIAGKIMKTVNSKQRGMFNQKVTKPLGLGIVDIMRANQTLEDIAPLLFDKLCQLAVRKEFSLISREHLEQRINFMGKEWLISKLKETLEEFIAESLSQPHSLSFSNGC